MNDNLTERKTVASVPAFMSWHPSLRKMRRTLEPMLEDYNGDAFAVLAQLAILNGRESFWRDEVSR